MKRGDDGVTLIELLVCIAIMGIVMSALATSFFASTKSIDDSSAQMSNTHDSQMAASFFSSDMQSSNWLWTATAPLGFQTCGSGSSIVTFAWVGSDSLGNELTKVATYRVINQGGEEQLVRYFCSGPVLAVTPTSTVVIAHNLYGGDPSVACFGAASTLPASCDGQNVAVAQLTAQAKASPTDTRPFDYILRATRRQSTSQPPSPPSWVQTNADEKTGGRTTKVTFSQANTPGNLIVAYVVWDNPGAVTVTDSNNNTYTPASARVPWGAAGPFGPLDSAQVFYAKNVAGGTNTVTATFGNGLSRFGLLYVTEYSGIDKTNPFDGPSADATGTGAAMNSGTATTTNPNDLLVGLGASFQGTVNAAGAGYATRSTFSGNIVEDRTVVSPGAYSATATQVGGPDWVMQLVAFRADAAGSLP